MFKLHETMDLRTFVFATRGHCIKGKQCQHITIKNQSMYLCSKQSSLFSFYALSSGGKSKGAVVHSLKKQTIQSVRLQSKFVQKIERSFTT